MQVTELQVQRSLHALSLRSSDPAEPGPDHGTDAVPAGLVERLAEAPAVRHDRLAEATERLHTGAQPTSEDLAGRMVGRLVCDRLR